jgi:hypothetical protein
MVQKIIFDWKETIHGWSPLSLNTIKESLININISGVYNPMPDFVRFLSDINDNKKSTWEVNQEGFFAIIESAPSINGQFITITTKTDMSKIRIKDQGFYKKQFRRTKRIVVNKKQFINTASSSLLEHKRKNKVEMSDLVYNLSFDEKKLITIKKQSQNIKKINKNQKSGNIKKINKNQKSGNNTTKKNINSIIKSIRKKNKFKTWKIKRICI